MVAWFNGLVRAAIYRPTAGPWWTRRGGGPRLVRLAVGAVEVCLARAGARPS